MACDEEAGQMGIRTLRHSIRSAFVVAVVTVVALVAPVAPAAAVRNGQSVKQWVGSWATSPQAPTHYPFGAVSGRGFDQQTLRLVVHPHFSGSPVRLRLANTFGQNTVTLGPVYVGVRATGAAVVPGTNRVVTFGDARTVRVPVGAEVLSDPVEIDVQAEQDLVVSAYAPAPTGPATYHLDAHQFNYLAAGNHTTEPGGAAFTTTLTSWFFLNGVDVRAASGTAAVVTLGDSITDGAGSTLNTNHRYPDFLAQRLLAQPDNELSVLNEGISANRLLNDSPCFGPSALNRLHRDVLAQHGVRTVILLEGINDIAFSHFTADNQIPGVPLACFLPNDDVSAAQIISGYQQIITRVHAAGLRILGGTLTPWQGSSPYSEAREATREAVNDWIRTSGAFDGVIDFDLALRDPANPRRLLPAYDSGDHIHPSDAGYAAMADAVSLNLL
jgi:lysophospholipase L1-like esterase